MVLQVQERTLSVILDNKRTSRWTGSKQDSQWREEMQKENHRLTGTWFY